VADQISLSALGVSLSSGEIESPAHLTKLASLSAAVGTSKYLVDASLVGASIIQHSLQFGAESGLRF